MASSRKTLDVDILTLNKVLIHGPNNSIIPSSCVLVSDGRGGTYWSLVSTVGTYPSFQQININSNAYSATPKTQTFSFLSGNGIGFADAGPGSNGTYVYAKAFQTIAVQGLSSLTAFTSNTLTPALTFSTLGGLQLSTDTTHQVLYFNAGIKNFNVLSNTSTFTNNLTGTNLTSFPITPSFSTLTFLGTGDITVTPTTNNAVIIGINGFTSASYNALSTQVYTLQSSILTTASTLYIYKSDFGAGISSFSTSVGQQLSSYQISSTYLALSTLMISNISTFSTLYSTLSTNISFNISTLSSYYYGVNQSTLSTFIYTRLVSTTVGFTKYYSTANSTIIGNFSTSLRVYSMSSNNFNSTMLGLTRRLVSTNFSTILMSSNIAISTFNFTKSYLSSMSTTMTSTFISLFTPRTNLVSSLNYTGARGEGLPFTLSNNGFYLSSLSLNLSTAIRAITSLKTNVSIDYNPVILFPMGNSAVQPPQLISTYIVYESTIPGPTTTFTIIPNTTFTDYISWNPWQSGGDGYVSNVYSKSMRIGISTGFLTKNTAGTYNMYHALPTAGVVTNVFTNLNSTMHIRTSLQNSAFLNIFNS